MALATRHRSDRTSLLPTLPELSVARETDAATMASLMRRTRAEIERRFAAGHP